MNAPNPLAAAVAAAATLAAGAAAAVPVVLDPIPAAGPLAIGDPFEVAVRATDEVSGYVGVNVDVAYDAGLLSYRGATFNPLFDFAQDAQSEPADAAGPTTVQNISAATLFGVGDGAATLATLRFVTVDDGVAEVVVSGTSGALISTLGGPVDATLSVSVAVVPLPAAGALLGGALLVLAARRGGGARP